MDINTLLTFISDNFTPLLTAISVLSFIMNLIQYKTNRDVQYHLDSIYQSCVNSIRIGRESDWTKDEFIHILYMIRIQATSGLRSIGIKRGYGKFDEITNQGWLYRSLANIYRTLLKAKEKSPKLFGKSETVEEHRKVTPP